MGPEDSRIFEAVVNLYVCALVVAVGRQHTYEYIRFFCSGERVIFVLVAVGCLLTDRGISKMVPFSFLNAMKN